MIFNKLSNLSSFNPYIMGVDLKISRQESTGSLWTKRARRHWKRKNENQSTRNEEWSSFNSFKTLWPSGQLRRSPVLRPLEVELTLLFPTRPVSLMPVVDPCETCTYYLPPQEAFKWVTEASPRCPLSPQAFWIAFFSVPAASSAGPPSRFQLLLEFPANIEGILGDK